MHILNILLINHYAGSPAHGMEYRPYYMAREWSLMDHEVTVVGASFSHLRSVQPKVHGAITIEMLDGVRYIWLSTPLYQGNGLGRVLNMAAFISQLFRFSGHIVALSSPGFIIASSVYPLDMLPARHMAKKTGAKIVFEVHDLWPLSPMELGGMSPRHPFIMAMQWAENYAYKNADKVVSILPEAAEHMIRHGMALGKFVHIPNGIDVQEWESLNTPLPDEHETLLERLRREGHFILGYAGAHGVANALKSLIQSGALFKDSPAAIVLVGSGPEKQDLQKLAAEQNSDNVFFLPPVPKGCIPRVAVHHGRVINEAVSVLARRAKERKRLSEFGELLEKLVLQAPKESITWISLETRQFYSEIMAWVRDTSGVLNFHDALIALGSRELGS